MWKTFYTTNIKIVIKGLLLRYISQIHRVEDFLSLMIQNFHKKSCHDSSKVSISTIRLEHTWWAAKVFLFLNVVKYCSVNNDADLLITISYYIHHLLLYLWKISRKKCIRKSFRFSHTRVFFKEENVQKNVCRPRYFFTRKRHNFRFVTFRWEIKWKRKVLKKLLNYH